MKPYHITISRHFKRPDVTYEIMAKDREDAIAFTKKVHRVDFKRVKSCRQIKEKLTDRHVMNMATERAVLGLLSGQGGEQ